MRRIRKTVTAKIAAVFRKANQIEYFLDRNEYQGGDFSPGLSPIEQKYTLDDIQNCHAYMYEADRYQSRQMPKQCDAAVNPLNQKLDFKESPEEAPVLFYTPYEERQSGGKSKPFI